MTWSAPRDGPGRVGAAGDNAAMESFFALLQKNVLDPRTWAARQELRIAIVTWIERTYHRRRRQKRLARLTPVECETIVTPPAALAASTPLSPDHAAVPGQGDVPIPVGTAADLVLVEAALVSSWLGSSSIAGRESATRAGSAVSTPTGA